ncbi:biosynthetic-type acetolactate synthase large subunit [Pseudorhodoferax sp.]|uniref:biosynthetic-type acetolactate synthase large subunit n=1 Tax=Pseudorhodoferax sp. TaxID=1993553 RepID=UPI002DD65FB5|nr:biosynthetic-type acetolactate synthase large subunit [Pseudorhodoferax sp.]
MQTDLADPAPPAVLSGPSAPGAPSAPTGAAWLIRTLLDLGVDTVFGYPGGAVLPLYDALHAEPRLRHVLVRHEQAAVHAAEGYARSTGRVGVVFVTSGPGVANTVSGLLDAYSDSIPLLLVSGQVRTDAIGTQAFQECDALAITRSVTKAGLQLSDPAQVAAAVRGAHALALQGRPGPVLIDFPKDVQAATVPAQAPGPLPGLAVSPNSADDGLAERAEQAMAALASARRPIFYGGGGLVSAGEPACRHFAELVRRSASPCTLTLMGLGAFPASDPAWLGMLGMHGTLEANLAMHEADLVIAVGARFDDRVTGRLRDFCPQARFIHLDIDAAQIGRVVPPWLAFTGDCALSLRALLAAWGERPVPERADWWQRIEAWRARDSLRFRSRPDAIAPQALLRALNRQLRGRDAIVSTDVGQHQMWVAQHIGFERPRRLLTSGGAGTMGYGLPAAIGAQLAHPGRLVVCVSGDASVLMNIQELASAVQHRAPVKLIVVNNGRMGMVRQWQQLHHGGRYSHSYSAALPDFVQVARGFGWQASRLQAPQQLEQALADCLASDAPYFLDVVVPEDDNCYPMIPAGAGHHELMLAPA